MSALELIHFPKCGCEWDEEPAWGCHSGVPSVRVTASYRVLGVKLSVARVLYPTEYPACVIAVELHEMARELATAVGRAVMGAGR